jgi:hypothetical protein
MTEQPTADESLTLHEIELTADVPDVELLPRYPILPCDGHAEPNIQAILDITLTSGGTLYLCGSCGNKAGFAQHQNLPTWLRENSNNKTKGSEN